MLRLHKLCCDIEHVSLGQEIVACRPIVERARGARAVEDRGLGIWAGGRGGEIGVDGRGDGVRHGLEARTRGVSCELRGVGGCVGAGVIVVNELRYLRLLLEVAGLLLFLNSLLLLLLCPVHLCVAQLGVLRVAGRGAVRPCKLLEARITRIQPTALKTATVFVLDLNVGGSELILEVGESFSTFWEDVWEIGGGSDTAKLFCDIVNYRLPAVIHVWFPEIPCLVVSNHCVKLLHSCDQCILSVFENFGVASW